MNEQRESDGLLARVAALISRRRAEAFIRGVALRAAYMLECRDLYDAEAEDAGVCFVLLRRESDVDAAVEELGEAGRDERLLGIFDLHRPLAEQGAGMTGDEWLARRVESSAGPAT